VEENKLLFTKKSCITRNKQTDNNKKTTISNSIKELNISTYIKPMQDKFKEIVNEENINNEKQAKCEVCKDFRYYGNDQSVFCDLCFGCVHQSCYKRELKEGVPKGDWFCERCRFLIRDKRQINNIKCEYCLSQKGIIIKIEDNKYKYFIYSV
jgi:hypothetical protein